MVVNPLQTGFAYLYPLKTLENLQQHRNLGQNICRLFQFLAQFFTISETELERNGIITKYKSEMLRFHGEYPAVHSKAKF